MKYLIKWNKWRSFDEAPDYEKSGVYCVRLKASIISRFLETDHEGILMIGCSTNIGRRLSNFKKVLDGKKYKHSEAKRFCNVRTCNNYLKYNTCVVEYSFVKTKTGGMALEKESELLNCYFSRYGEMPPLNNNSGKLQ